MHVDAIDGFIEQQLLSAGGGGEVKGVGVCCSVAR